MSSARLQQATLVFIGGTILSCVCSGRWLLSGETNIINALASFNTLEIQSGGGWAVPKGLVDFFSALITALAWNYPFLSSPWAIFIKVPLWLISIGVIVALVAASKSLLQGFLGVFRGGG